jgi:hypothetical protein
MAPLWRVEVAGVSHRYVEADTVDQAVATVRAAIVESFDLQARPASSPIAQVYDELTRSQKKKVLTALDGLISPDGLSDAKRARRRLARQIKYDSMTRAWVKSKLATAPPIPDPEVIRRLFIQVEAQHVQDVRRRLRDLGAIE